MPPTLVVLAAGLGSRYGGLKQLDPVGPSGEIILDYSLFDARRAGFNRVVFVIRKETESAFHARFASRIPAGMTAAYAFQETDDLPAPISNFKSQISNREKPWGTGHAVWCARHAVTGPFAVINADDFYGAAAFRTLADFLQRTTATRYAMIGYRLSNTLSEHGLVSRGVCDVLAAPKPGEGGGAAGKLRAIVEQKGIAATEVGAGKKFSGTETVSMNCWGFSPALFADLEQSLRDFLATATAGQEFYLPAAVSAMVSRGEATVEVLPTPDSWFGVTYREDRPRVSAALASLIAAGSYPSKL